MRITVEVNGKPQEASVPCEGADHVLLDVACPHCKAAPLKAKGLGVTSHDHDTYYADAASVCCSKPLGRMRTKVDTLFGIEEDEAVLNGRARVYR